jgi:hypothetical protein
MSVCRWQQAFVMDGSTLGEGLRNPLEAVLSSCFSFIMLSRQDGRGMPMWAVTFNCQHIPFFGFEQNGERVNAGESSRYLGEHALRNRVAMGRW